MSVGGVRIYAIMLPSSGFSVTHCTRIRKTAFHCVSCLVAVKERCNGELSFDPGSIPHRHC